MGPGGGLKVKGQRLTLRRQRLQKERIGGWAEEPKGHAPSAPPAPPSPAAGSGAKRAEHRERAAWGGDPASAGLARRLRSPSSRPSGRAARAAPGRWRCTFRSVRRAAGLERWRAVGAPGRDPELSPLPGNGGAAGAEEQATLGHRVRPRWRGCSGVPAGGSPGGGAAIRPSRPACGRCLPREPEAGTAGARQRG